MSEKLKFLNIKPKDLIESFNLITYSYVENYQSMSLCVTNRYHI